ncbi:MAG: amino acid carrier protein, partial [Candidatus Methanomethylophilaceae archaeon]|nr:amino acid carrier protein [Candidatus Methanomethylophilaceae archaeon]
MSITQTLTDIFNPLNTYVWYIAFVFLVGLGIYFMIKLKGLPILKIKETSKLALGGAMEESGKTVSSFEAFCIGLGARVGVGNIAGVASAIVLGGPGAVFWMWIFAIIGSASSFMESTLSQIFKEKKSDGQFHSGPAYYVQKGLKSRPLAIVLAILIVITFGIGFVGVQAANSVSALANAFSFENSTYVFATIIAFAAAIIIFGGVKRIASFSAKVVPPMAVLWLLLGAVVIAMNYDHIIDAISMIFTYAFQWESAAGGLLGAVIMNGLKRGVFSNEAGLGSIANIAGTADTKHPVKQGMIQSFGTLV